MIVNFYFFAKIACIIANKITLLILLFIFLSQDMVSQTGDSPDSLHGQTAFHHFFSSELQIRKRKRKVHYYIIQVMH